MRLQNLMRGERVDPNLLSCNIEYIVGIIRRSKAGLNTGTQFALGHTPWHRHLRSLSRLRNQSNVIRGALRIEMLTIVHKLEAVRFAKLHEFQGKEKPRTSNWMNIIDLG